MKTTQTERAVLALLLLCAVFLAGLLVGRSSVKPVTLLAPAAEEPLVSDTRVLPPVEPEPTEPIALPAPSDKADKQLDLNTATLQELIALPGIGETLAERILSYRAQYGDFLAVDELSNVYGIGQKTLDALRPYITVGTSTDEIGGSS